jgi:mono/diheme cytochrome c family protein
MNVFRTTRINALVLFTSTFLFGTSSQAAPPTAPLPADHAEKMAKGQELFTKHVRAILIENCLKCHGGAKTQKGFDISTRESFLKGSDNGVVVELGKAKDSRLVDLIGHKEMPYMPSKEDKLSADKIAKIADWIDLGAPYDKPLLDKPTVKKPLVVTDEDRKFWSFQPLKRPPVPEVQDATWCRTPLDRFVLTKLADKGLSPNAAADKRTLIRRAYFDLVGLPPTPEEIDRFVNDPAPDAYDKLLDHLLASPQHGERWARHWLDVARFAESHGYEQDYDRPTAYHYRDFVIKAFNSDLPYDKFVKWQIAGDEYEPDNPLALMATGFLAAGTHATQITKNQVEKERYDELDDMARTVGTAMLGVTIGCARCHDHKYDPIPTKDYYRLLSTFTTTVRSEVEIDLDPKGNKEIKAKYDAEQRHLLARLRGYEQMSAPAVLDDPTADPHWRRLHQLALDHAKAPPKLAITKALISTEGLPAVRLHTQGGDFLEHTNFLTRGDPNQKGEVATQGFLQVLMRDPDLEKHWQAPPPSGWRTSYQRRALAEWITDVDHGAGHLLARVIVNRLWQHHLGAGIVATPSDFGFQGDRPTHPELLDFLASELIEHGWSLKHVHKLIMTSAVYRESTQVDSANAKVDARNRLVWRRTPQRLEGEAIRDALLAVSGQLDLKQFGPGTLDPNMKRRSIYFFVKRSQLVAMMVLFDGPDTLQGLEQRITTTIAPQSLLLLNNGQVRSCAESFAKHISSKDGLQLEDLVMSAYAHALGRRPKERELADSVSFLKEQAESYTVAGKSDPQQLALTDFCQALLGLNEFIYVD